jgi:hypothetical protein
MDQTIHVWHDKSGRILAWGYGGSPDKSPLTAVPLAGRNQKAITVRVSDHLLGDLHDTHRVDLRSGELVVKANPPKKSEKATLTRASRKKPSSSSG